jgi:hypothetical protein
MSRYGDVDGTKAGEPGGRWCYATGENERALGDGDLEDKGYPETKERRERQAICKSLLGARIEMFREICVYALYHHGRGRC